jgi:hypothetical protein
MTLQVSQRLGVEYNRAQLVSILQEIERAVNRIIYVGAVVTWNPGDIADGDDDSTTATVPGVVVGAKQSVRVFPPYDLEELQVTAYVSADNTVEIVLTNSTGSNVNLAEGEWGVMVEFFPPES